MSARENLFRLLLVGLLLASLALMVALPLAGNSVAADGPLFSPFVGEVEDDAAPALQIACTGGSENNCGG